MPIYEYECKQCGERTEALQRLADPPLTTCETCGGELKRLISSPSFQFKGSGWYVTDYARAGAGGGTDSSSPAEKKSAPAEAKTATAAASDAGADKGSASKSKSD